MSKQGFNLSGTWKERRVFLMSWKSQIRRFEGQVEPRFIEG